MDHWHDHHKPFAAEPASLLKDEGEHYTVDMDAVHAGATLNLQDCTLGSFTFRHGMGPHHRSAVCTNQENRTHYQKQLDVPRAEWT